MEKLYEIFEVEMSEWEREKFDELLQKISPQMSMIESMLRQISGVVDEYRENYNLEFDEDVQREIREKVIELI